MNIWKPTPELLCCFWSRFRLVWPLALAVFTMSLAAPTFAQTARPANDQGATKPGAKAAPAPAPVPIGEPDPAVGRILKIWEQKGQDTDTLQVTFKRTVNDVEKKVDFGQAWIQSPYNLKVSFSGDEIKPNTKTRDIIEKERILFTEKEIWRYIFKQKEINIYPIKDKNAQLNQHPLRFLFQMNSKEAWEKYAISLMSQKDPKFAEKYHLILIVPRNARERRDDFTKVYIWLDKTTFIPGAIRVYSENNPHEDYLFTEIIPNPTLEDNAFRPVKYEKWKVIVDPLGQENQDAPAGKSAPRTNPTPNPNRKAAGSGQ